MSRYHFETPAARLGERLARLSPEKQALVTCRFTTQNMGGYDLAADALGACGISHLYGVAGKPTEEILPACARRGIRPLGVYHQTSAVCMATAHNYQAGRLVAAALVSAGPAVTNALTGMLVARDNAWPVLVLGGRRSSFQRCNALPLIAEVAKHALAASRTASIHGCIQEAHQIAVSGRPGPVYVELPEDVLAGRGRPGSGRAAADPLPPWRLPTVAEPQIHAIADALLGARRPALLVGKGVRWTVVPAELQELIEAFGLAFITSPMGRGFVPDDHPLCFNRARTALQAEADVVLVLGARLDWVFRHGTELSHAARVFRVDVCHDPDDDGAIAVETVHGDVGELVHRLLAVHTSRTDAVRRAARTRSDDWHLRLRAAAAATQDTLERQMDTDRRPMSPYRMMKEVRDALPREAICVTEGNISMMAAQAVIPAFRPASRMDAGTNACMGVGIPFGLGAKVACPDRPVVAIVGDYGFSLSAMELEACVRHAIPIVVLVANNQGNNGGLKQRAYFPDDTAERVTMFGPGIEYDRIMRAFGGRGRTIADPRQLGPALARALARGEPACINVVVDPDAPLSNAWGVQSDGRELGP
jgi:2-hydroxyacyl-CoA lyase 1